MKLRINYNYINIIIISSFFFFWGLNFENTVIQNKNIKVSYLIILLIIPIIFNLIKNNYISLKQVFNYQKYIIFFTLFVIVHYFFVKIYYDKIISKSEIFNLFYLFLLSIIYCHYRNFINDNFKKILTVYLIIFVLVSIFEGAGIYNKGQCNSDIYLINILREYLNITLTNSIYKENSHLAMMSTAVIFSSLFILLKEKKKYSLFLLLSSIGIIILLNNLSTTYFVCYFVSQVTILLFFFKKIDIKFWVITLLILSVNSYLFLSDKNCVKKIQDFEIESIIKNDLEKKEVNLTTLIYQRSIIIAKNTIINHSLGWGIDGMDDATKELHNDYFICNKQSSPDKCESVNIIYWPLYYLNIKDGLTNSFKLITEYGIFAFFIFIMFIKYMISLKNINSYNIFIICLFVTLCIRGAGYFNGGFIFCLLEFFYFQNINFKSNKVY
mgnify:CR=1 FL=1|jgi:hypothetical protein